MDRLTLVIMPKRLSSAKVAAILYVILALFAAFAPNQRLWATSFDAFAGFLSRYEPGLMGSTHGLLLVMSLALAATLFARSPLGTSRLGVAAVLALVAFSLNVVMGFLWLLPALFCLLASRENLSTDPSHHDRPPAGGD